MICALGRRRGALAALRNAVIGGALVGLAACVVLSAMPARAATAPTADTPATAAEARQQILVLLNLPPQHFRPDGNYSGSYTDAAGRAARRRVAAQLAREHGLTMASDWPMPMLGVDCFVMNVPLDQAPQRVAQDLSHDARVSWAQTMNVYRAQAHDDPLFAIQPVAREWQLAELHESATGRRVRIAVIDSGVERVHPDLTNQIEQSENFVAGRPMLAELHGTAVAGIIGAQADNGIGIVGVAPHARLLALRACWQEAPDVTVCSSLSLARALQFAIEHDADVVNLSLSGPPDRLLARLLDVALVRGIVVVAAADRGAADGGFPASHRGVVAVVDSAVDGGPPTMVLAPGRDVPTTLPGARWAVVSGASYAAAHISGLFALVHEARERRASTSPKIDTDAVHALARLPDGRIDACATLARAAGTCSCGCTAARLLPAVARQ